MVRAEYSLDIIVTKLQEILDYGIGYSDVVGQISFPLLIALFAFAFPFLFSVINHTTQSMNQKVYLSFLQKVCCTDFFGGFQL